MSPSGRAQQLPPAGRDDPGAPLPAAAEAKPAKRSRKPTAMQQMSRGEHVSGNVVRCADGKLRWRYEMKLLRNPTIFLLVWKIFFFILLGIFAFTAVVDLIEWGAAAQLLTTLKMFGYFLIGMTVLVVLGCLVYAAIMGGKYCVMFEMDQRGVNHKQEAAQAKKAQTISDLTVLAGLAAGRASTVGAGLAASRTEMYTEFARVRKVKACPRRGLIKIVAGLSHNQVYAAPEDFDFVLNYILSHCENLK